MPAVNIKHISIIMDGNGRWASQKHLPRALGHRAGIKSINYIVKACSLRQIKDLTLFAFSSENWKRPDQEVSFLINLFSESIYSYIDNLNENNIIVSFIGDRDQFDQKLSKSISYAENLTSNNTGMRLNIAVNYGGKWDIINAFKKLCLEHNGNIEPDMLDEKEIAKHLSVTSTNPDLLIRTGGERRLSNFMLWQHAYTELYFTDCLWPDFDVDCLDQAIEWFQKRDRKYGALEEQKLSFKKDA